MYLEKLFLFKYNYIVRSDRMKSVSRSKAQLTVVKKIISLIFTLFFLYMLLVFIRPTAANIFNAGNTAGVLVSAFLAFCSIYYEKVFKIIKNICQKKVGKIILIILSVLILLGISLCIFLSVLMSQAMNNYPPEAKPVIVLGSKLNGDVPSEMLTRRLEAAEKYLKENTGTICVVSGGQGKDESISEAQAMRKYLVNAGISPERITEEDRSVNTNENIRFSKELIKGKTDTDEVVIITDGFHQYRAGFLAEQNGMKAYAVNAQTNPNYVPTYWVREWIGIVKDKLLSAF